jgi:hypothetical protein
MVSEYVRMPKENLDYEPFKIPTIKEKYEGSVWIKEILHEI